ncbi:MAG: hypothetical protein R3C14_10965 [Caldilineaceae bacterium]
MRVNVKPLTHWVITKGYTIRFHQRTPRQVTGVLNTPAGAVDFTYDPVALVVSLPDEQITINEYGWEIPAHASKQGSL